MSLNNSNTFDMNVCALLLTSDNEKHETGMMRPECRVSNCKSRLSSCFVYFTFQQYGNGCSEMVLCDSGRATARLALCTCVVCFSEKDSLVTLDRTTEFNVLVL